MFVNENTLFRNISSQNEDNWNKYKLSTPTKPRFVNEEGEFVV